MLKLILRLMSLLTALFCFLLFGSLSLGRQNPQPLIVFLSERQRFPDLFLADSASALHFAVTESRIREVSMAWSSDGRYLSFDYFDTPDSSLMILDTEDWAITELELGEFSYTWWYEDAWLLVHINRTDESWLVNVETGEEQPYVERECADCGSDWVGAYDLDLSIVDGNLLVEIDRSRYLQGVFEPNKYLQPISPDGQYFLFITALQGQPDIYLSPVDGGFARRLTNNPTPEQSFAWSWDGTKISYVSYEDGNPEIYVLELATGYRYNISRDPSRDDSPIWQRLP
jgi:hypothetical protein